MFEDAAALQLAFIKERDERCKGLISSRAFLVVENTVIEQVSEGNCCVQLHTSIPIVVL